MSFTAEWTAATGFNTNGYTVTFGKPLNQCSVDELLAHPMCGSNNPLGNCAYVVKYDDLGYGSVAMHLLNAQFKEPIPNAQSNTWVCDPAPTGDLAKIYRRTIFVGMPTNVTAPQYCLTDESDNRILIIENIKDPNKLVYNYGNISFTAGAVSQYRTCANQLRHTCNKGQSTYSSAPNTVTYEDPDTHTTTVYKICAYQVYVIDNDCFICGWDYIGHFLGRYQNENNAYNGLTWGSSFTSFKHENGNCLYIGTNVNATGSETNLEGIFGDDIYADPVPDPATFVNTYIDYAPTNIELQNVKLRFNMGNSTIGGSLRSCTLIVNLYDTEEIRKQQMARAGIYFAVNGELFKPIISGGIVTGYGTPDKESEIDGYTDLNHPVPSGGGGGGGDINDEDNKDPVNTAGAPFAAGLCNYYAMTAGSPLLGHISEALGAWDIANTSKDLYKNLISCKLVKPPAPIPTTGSAPFTIYGVKPQYAGADISLPVVSGNPEATFGPYQISRKFNDFRDYAPYTRVSIYLPYCGWCDLPSHVVGRKVSVKYFTDIIAATCKAVVFCLSGDGSNIVAEAAGVIGLDIPFAADNVGAKMQAVTAGMIAALGGGIQLGAGIGTMVSTKSGSGAKAALSGASQYLSGYSQMAMAFNENTTEISGKNGDGCCLAGATNIIIKIVRPKKGAYTDAPYTPPGYGHNVGYVSQKQVKVSSVSGLLIADNVDTSGISGATEAERAEIKRVLETGLIVNAAPE